MKDNASALGSNDCLLVSPMDAGLGELVEPGTSTCVATYVSVNTDTNDCVDAKRHVGCPLSPSYSD